LSALNTFTHVHIATHGFANDSLPGLSGLVMAAPGGTPEILYARETYGLRSNADLLVLSACETGLGRIARGEGVLALTHGFLSAGIHNVVYSLWRVMDRPSSELMKSFYRNMSPGARYEEALRKAKLEMIRSSATAFPYHWAGFVLIHGQGNE
jgi:CHAT domain-containing protein